MIRRLGFASLLVVVCAFGGASAGPARTLPSRQIVATVAWLDASEREQPESRPRARPVAASPVARGSTSPRSVGLRRFIAERWLFQRPPPIGL